MVPFEVLSIASTSRKVPSCIKFVRGRGDRAGAPREVRLWRERASGVVAACKTRSRIAAAAGSARCAPGLG